MCSAVPESQPFVLDRSRCVESIVRGITKLADEFAINVVFGMVDELDCATTEPGSRTITIDHRLDVGDVAYLIRDLWNYLTIGDHASFAEELPGLFLVPQPPTTTKEATA